MWALQGVTDAGLGDKGMLCMSQIIALQLQQWGATLHLAINGFLFTPGLQDVPPIQPYFIPLIYNKMAILQLTQQSANTGQCLGWRVTEKEAVRDPYVKELFNISENIAWLLYVEVISHLINLQNTVSPKSIQTLKPHSIMYEFLRIWQ